MFKNYKLAAAVSTTVVLWASGFVGIEMALVSYTPVQIAVLRFSIASILLFVIGVVRNIRIPRRRDWSRLLVTGFIGITLYNISLNYGKQFVTSGTASFIVNIAPICTMLLSSFFLKEYVHFRQIIGVGIALCGVAVLTINEGFSSLSSSWLLLVTPLCQGAFFVLQKPLLTRYTPFDLICYTIWAGTICMLPFAHQLVDAFRTATWSANTGIIYLGLAPSVVGYLCWAYVLSKMQASKAATFLYIVPLVTIVIA